MGYSEKELDEIDMAKVCMILQRVAEPGYKAEIDKMIRENREQDGRYNRLGNKAGT